MGVRWPEMVVYCIVDMHTDGIELRRNTKLWLSIMDVTDGARHGYGEAIDTCTSVPSQKKKCISIKCRCQIIRTLYLVCNLAFETLSSKHSKFARRVARILGLHQISL